MPTRGSANGLFLGLLRTARNVFFFFDKPLETGRDVEFVGALTFKPPTTVVHLLAVIGTTTVLVACGNLRKL